MKLIITEEQLRMIVENEEYVSSIKDLINTFDPNNIEIAFQIMDSLEIKPSVILDEYTELFDILDLKPNKENFINIFNKEYVEINTDISPNLLFKLPNLKRVRIKKVGNLDHLVEIRTSMTIRDSSIKSIPNLVVVDGTLEIFPDEKTKMELPNLKFVSGSLHFTPNAEIRKLPELEYVGGSLVLFRTKIESLPKLKEVGGELNVFETPLSYEFSKDELNKKIKIGRLTIQRW